MDNNTHTPQMSENATTALTQNPTTASRTSSALELTERQTARRRWLRETINRFQAASGTALTVERIAVIARELDIDEYTHAQAAAAERWITRGSPARYGTLTLPDFYPTQEQLATVGYDIGAELRHEYDHGYDVGYQDGHSAGTLAEAARWQQNQEYMRERAVAAEAVDLTAKINLLLSRERDLAEREARFAEREAEMKDLDHVIRAARAEPEEPPTVSRRGRPYVPVGELLRQAAERHGINPNEIITEDK